MNSIIIKNDILSPSDLLKRLEDLNQKNTYIFRGQPSKEFILQPNAFRRDTLKKLSNGYLGKNGEIELRQRQL